jgi:hypothetical protein
MKRLIIPLLSVVALLVGACGNKSSQQITSDSTANRKTAKEIIQIDTVKVNKSASTFYAVCAEEHFGWCSPQYSTYDEANDALKKHRDSTGHTDNTVSNDCPF